MLSYNNFLVVFLFFFLGLRLLVFLLFFSFCQVCFAVPGLRTAWFEASVASVVWKQGEATVKFKHLLTDDGEDISNYAS